MKKITLTTATLLATVIGGVAHLSAQAEEKTTSSKPNIVYFLCDDLGIGEVGCFGQKIIETPHIDALAKQGMLFTQHYSGSTVCAPSRCSLMTGLHTGHTQIRGNLEIEDGEGQSPIAAGTNTLARVLKKDGYKTACVGKWGLGPMDSEGSPLKQGFDHFYGYNCQRHAHSYYPAYLWNDNQKIDIGNGKGIPGHSVLPDGVDTMNAKEYERFISKNWTPDLMSKDAEAWLRQNANEPFFFYYATPLPHVGLQVPLDRLEKHKHLDTRPYLAGKEGYYSPQRYPRSAYAAMVEKIDEDVGMVMRVLKEMGQDKNTIIMFCSDNGPTWNGGSQSTYFKSARDSRGLKCSMYEGGIRVPFIVSWPGKIAPHTTSDLVCSMWDAFPTICEVTGSKSPEKLDGINIMPTLLGKGKQNQHDYLYWEDNQGKATYQAMRIGDYKAHQTLAHKKFELYNLKEDPTEKKDLSKVDPERVDMFKKMMVKVRTDNQLFDLKQPPKK